MKRGLLVGIATVLLAVGLSVATPVDEAQARHRRCGCRGADVCAGRHHHARRARGCCGTYNDCAPVQQCCGAPMNGYHDQGARDGDNVPPPPAPDSAPRPSGN